MAGALDGTRVIDFGQYIAGPLTGMLLADQGADVIRVDPPGGPRWDTPANATYNRGKRSIVLDFGRVPDRDTAVDLIRGADVLIENFRPGVMERLGLGAAVMTERNPRLIYCSLPGFAADDPRAGLQAWEGIVGAATATYRPSPLARGSERPTYTAIPIPSTYAAFQAAVSIAVALFARERDGLGQRIEVPLFDGMFASIGQRGLRVHQRSGPQLFRGVWGGEFLCKDGRWVRFGGAGNQNFSEFVQKAGIDSWEPGLLDFEQLRRDLELRRRAIERSRELFLTRAAQEWEDLVAEAGSECAICRTSEEWFSHPHARESEMVVEVEDRKLGKVLQPGINARMSRTPGRVRGPAPAPDAHRAGILAELEARPPEPPADREVDRTLRRALEGVRVLDLCIILAGPTLGRTLAEFGADVIKIDSPLRGAGRGIAFHNDVNRGKRSLLLDLKSGAGRDIFWQLLARADVVAENYRSGKLEKLGLSYEEIRARKPDIIHASTNAYGYSGPWRPRPGHEQFAQATTGMSLRFGGDGPPMVQPNAVNDYGTGYMGAFAVALALLHRQRTGEGQHVNSALAYTAMTLQAPFMLQYDGKTWAETRGQDAVGSGPLHRAYRAADGWLFLGARASELSRLASVEGLSRIEGLEGSALEGTLERCFAAEPVHRWIERLSAIDVGAHEVVMDVQTLMEDAWVRDHGLSVTREHDELGPITTCGPAPRLSRTPVRIGRPAPKPGSDAASILAEIGQAARLDELVERGVIRLDGIRAG